MCQSPHRAYATRRRCDCLAATNSAKSSSRPRPAQLTSSPLRYFAAGVVDERLQVGSAHPEGHRVGVEAVDIADQHVELLAVGLLQQRSGRAGAGRGEALGQVGVENLVEDLHAVARDQGAVVGESDVAGGVVLVGGDRLFDPVRERAVLRPSGGGQRAGAAVGVGLPAEDQPRLRALERHCERYRVVELAGVAEGVVDPVEHRDARPDLDHAVVGVARELSDPPGSGAGSVVDVGSVRDRVVAARVAVRKHGGAEAHDRRQAATATVAPASRRRRTARWPAASRSATGRWGGSGPKPSVSDSRRSRSMSTRRNHGHDRLSCDPDGSRATRG